MTKYSAIFDNVSYVDLCPIQFGYEICQPAHSISRRRYPNYLLHYIVAGQGSFANDQVSQSLVCRKQDAFLITPQTTVSYQADPDQPWTYYWLEFNGLKAASLMDKAGLKAESPLLSQVNDQQDKEIQELFQQLIASSSPERSMGLTYILLSVFIQSQSQYPGPEEDAQKNFYIREALKYISRQLHQPIPVDQLANHCHLSRSYLTQLFKDELGVTPAAFITEYRLQQAQELLKDPHIPIGDIARQVGYSNPFVFSNAFKRRYQVSPSVWRQAYLSQLQP